MTDADPTFDHIGDPDAVLADAGLDRDQKVARLAGWRDALRRRAEGAEPVGMDSGEADRLIAIERALHHLNASGA